MSVSSSVETPMTCTPGRKRLIRRVASIPLILGIFIIHDNDVRSESKSHLNGGLPVCGLTDDCHGFVGQKKLQRVSRRAKSSTTRMQRSHWA